MKYKVNKNNLKKKQRENNKECEFARISSTLLPSAALATAVPHSPRQVNLRRSPSPLSRAIASFTKVGHSIAGDLSPHYKNSGDIFSGKSESGSHTRGRTIARVDMKNRRPMPLPVENRLKEAGKAQTRIYETVGEASTYTGVTHISDSLTECKQDTNESIEDLYATVCKGKKTAKPTVNEDFSTDNHSCDRHDDDDDITVVSTGSEKDSLKNFIQKTHKSKQQKVKHYKIIPKKEKLSEHHSKAESKSNAENNCQSSCKAHIGPHAPVEKLISVDRKILKHKLNDNEVLINEDFHLHQEDPMLLCTSDEEETHRKEDNTLIIENPISEGELLHLKKSPEQISDVQRIYLSTESLDQEYLVHAREGMKNVRDVTSPPMVGSLNSSLSASNFISAERLMEKLSKSKVNTLEVIPSERLDELNQKYENSTISNGTAKYDEEQEREQISLKSKANKNKKITESEPFLENDSLRKETSYLAGNHMTAPAAPRLTKSSASENYLHMSPRRSSSSSLRHLSTSTKNHVTKNTPCLGSSRHLQKNEIQIRKSFNNRLMETVNMLKELSISVESPYQKQQTEDLIVMLHSFASENRQIIDNPRPIDNGSSVSLCSEHHQQTQHDMLTKKLQSVETDRRLLQELNQSLVDENNNLRHKVAGKDFNVENEHLLRQLKVISDENRAIKAKLSGVDNNGNMKCTDYGESFGAVGDSLKFDHSHLVRLLRVYDEKLREKSKLVTSYEDKLAEMELQQQHQQQQQTVPQEKKRLVKRMNPFGKNKLSKEAEQTDLSVSIDDWRHLKEQSKLVLEENQLLVEQKMLYKKTIDELTNEYQQEVTKLSKQTLKHVQEKKSLEHLLTESHLEVTQLRSRNEKLMKIIEEESINKEDYDCEIAKLRREYKMELNSSRNEMENAKAKCEAVMKEKSILAIQVTDLTATVSRLKQELELTEKNYWKCEKRLTHCLKHLDTLFGKEMNIKETLTNVVKVAEKNAVAKEHLEKVIESQKVKSKHVMDQLQMDDIKITQLQNKLQRQKEKSRKKVAGAHEKLEHHNKEMNSLLKTYEKEIDELKDIVLEKQRFIDRFQSSNRSTAAKMDEMWKCLCE